MRHICASEKPSNLLCSQARAEWKNDTRLMTLRLLYVTTSHRLCFSFLYFNSVIKRPPHHWQQLHRHACAWFPRRLLYSGAQRWLARSYSGRQMFDWHWLKEISVQQRFCIELGVCQQTDGYDTVSSFFLREFDHDFTTLHSDKFFLNLFFLLVKTACVGDGRRSWPGQAWFSRGWRAGGCGGCFCWKQGLIG